MNWGIKILLLYLGFITLIITLVTLSMNQKVDLVATDYYAQELAYQEKIDGAKNYEKLSTPIKITAENNILTIQYPNELMEHETTGSILLYRPSNSSLDYSFALQINSEGKQHITPKELKRGLYKVKFSYKSNGENYFTEQNLFIN
ncbi:MAG: FixH family protein [Bacteroidetes bacterium]|nr:FixH family protein [Bacteroidota bacterium]